MASNKFNEQLLRTYYDRLFPYKEMFKWLSYSNDSESPSTFFQYREFSFTLADDVYVRYRSFASKDEFRKEVNARQPHKIDIGAVYNAPPSMHTSVQGFAPRSKELVFDIDMTDYDDVRTCCSEGAVCRLCWPLMNAAIKVIDANLRDCFGFRHILWVYSGRRGVHCWVCDERARKLTNEQRTAVLSWLCVNIHGGDRSDLSMPLVPSLQNAFDTLQPYFERVCIDNQRVFDSKDQWDKVLERIPSTDLQASLNAAWEKDDASGLDRWNQLKESVNKWAARKDEKNNTKLRSSIVDIVFSRVYPRLDVNVSKQMHHLLKSPFCVHPKTGRVCVPIDPETCDDFDIDAVPTIDVLERELNEITDDDRGSKVNKTSMAPYMQTFQKFLTPLMKDAARLAHEAAVKKEQDSSAW